MVQALLVDLVVVLIQALSAMVLSAMAIYSGMGALDRMTHGIDEWKEIKKGNAAAGVLLVAIIGSIMLLMEPRIREFIFSVRSDLPVLFVAKLMVVSLLNYVLGLLASIFAVFLTIHLIDRITTDMDEFAELKKGNVAVALVFAAALVLIIIGIQTPFESLFEALQALESALV